MWSFQRRLKPAGRHSPGALPSPAHWRPRGDIYHRRIGFGDRTVARLALRVWPVGHQPDHRRSRVAGHGPDPAASGSISLKAEEQRLIVALGRFGFAARALVFTMIGLFLVYAAIDSNSREAKGFAGALRLIQQQPHGSLMAGRYRRGAARLQHLRSGGSRVWPDHQPFPAPNRREARARRLMGSTSGVGLCKHERRRLGGAAKSRCLA